jgi:uncharacterized membrane protein
MNLPVALALQSQSSGRRKANLSRSENFMDRMLVVVFDSETKTYAGRDGLLRLETEGTISVYAHAIIAKNADGTVHIEKHDDTGPIGTAVGIEVGSLVTLLSGPEALAIGLGTGFLAGGAADLHKARIAKDFVEDVSKELHSNRFALVAEIEEESTLPVDTAMEKIGGKVFRRTLAEVKHTIHAKHIAAMKADLAQFKVEHARADAKRKAKLQEKINQLHAKIRVQVRKAKEIRDAAEYRAKAKAEVLKAKAAALSAKAQETYF